jgi:hypothetical protein
MKMRKLLLTLLPLCLSANVVLCQSKRLNASDILDAYKNTMEKSLLYRETFAIKAEEKSTTHVPIGYPKGDDFSVMNYSFFRDHERLDSRLKHALYKNDEIRVATKGQYVRVGERGFQVNHRVDEQPSFAFAYTRDHWDRAISILGMTGTAMLVGYMEGDSDTPLWEVLKGTPDVQLRDAMEVVDGHKTYVLESKTNHGHYIAWFDPNCGFNLRRFVVRRRGTDLLDGKPVNSPSPPIMLPPGVKPSQPHGTVIEHVFTFDSVNFRKIDGFFLPDEGKTTMYRKYSNGEDMIHRKTFRILEIDFNPDFEKIEDAFVPDIPNGTRIFDTDFPNQPPRYVWKYGKLVPLTAQSIPLLDKPLPELKDIKIDMSTVDKSNKMILICFFDMDQRSSRNCLLQLNKRTQELKAKDVVVIAIQASKVDKDKLNDWVKNNNIPFPIGMIQSDENQTRFTWGVRSLPWLILTDKKHVVIAEGFGLNELGQKITEIENAKR